MIQTLMAHATRRQSPVLVFAAVLAIPGHQQIHHRGRHNHMADQKSGFLSHIPYSVAARNLLRDSVLGAVHELSHSNGWAATTIAAIAVRSGVSRQTIYKEFGSRQSLAEAYIVSRVDFLLDNMQQVFDTTEGDLEIRIRTALATIFDFFDEPLIHMTLEGGNIGSDDLVSLLKETNMLATKRVGAIVRTLNPNFSEAETIIAADTLVRVAVTHAIAPILTREEAVDRMVWIAMRLLPDPQ
jgi:AcrR family transcriptional regulator